MAARNRCFEEVGADIIEEDKLENKNINSNSFSSFIYQLAGQNVGGKYTPESYSNNNNMWK